MDIIHVVDHAHEHIIILSGVSSEVQCSLSRGTIWKSSSSSSEYSGVLSGGYLSAELKDKCLCTGLGGACGVLHGVVGAGSNEACSMLETW